MSGKVPTAAGNIEHGTVHDARGLLCGNPTGLADIEPKTPGL